MAHPQSEPQPAAETYPLLLDAQLCFDLYAASRAVTGLYRYLLEELGLTYPQYLVMLVLWERGAVPVKDLAEALQLDYGTLSPLVKRLEANGLVRRFRRVDDERSVLVAPTGDGMALREQARHIPAAVSRAMGLPPEEFEWLRYGLRALTVNVTRAAAGRA
jgi:MarR family transcriptional regulator, organic hydroperoxide resistance regulator